MNKLLVKFKSNARLRQIVSLLSINVIGIPLGIITSVLLTSYLGPKKFGDYTFINNVIGLAVVLGTFGFYYSGNRAIVSSKSKNEIKSYYGAELIITICLFLFIYFCLFIYSIIDNNLSEKGIKSEFLLVLPFFILIYLFIRFFEVLFQADNRIKLLGYSRLFPKILFVFAIFAIYNLLKDYSFRNKLLTVYICSFISQMGVFVFIFLKLSVSFKDVKIAISKIWKLNKSFGFHVYVGSVFSVGMAQLSGILISYFGMDNSGVGYYSLAMAIAAPLSFIPNTIATTHYKEFSELDKVPKKILTVTIGITLIGLLTSWLLINPFINYFYGEEFKTVINLFYIVSIGVALQGMADFYNRFLGSHGEGKMLRNSSIVVGICVLISNVVLIPLWSETGAAFTNTVNGVIYLFAIVYYYKIFRSKTEIKKNS